MIKQNPFIETLNTKEELFEDFKLFAQRKLELGQNALLAHYGLCHGEAIMRFCNGRVESLMEFAGIPITSIAYFQAGIRAWNNLFTGLTTLPKQIIGATIISTKKMRPLQQIFYGAPGTGKSYRIKNDERVKEADEKNLVFRTTFHPDSDYSTFVGAYKPTIGEKAVRNVAGDIVKNTNKEDVFEECITYSFVPQAFLQAYIAAWNNPEDNVFLVIEEINRGNCAQIFGDLFQLLDRDCDGFSEYPIMADNDLKKYLNGTDEEGKDVLTNKDGIKDGKLRLPKNLYIWATMNTSDQSLFPIDSAFKRRWDWVYVPIDTAKEMWYVKVGGIYYSWTTFLDKVNDELLTDETAEDKHLGFYFCKATEKKDGTESDPNVITADTFVGKVLFYLWNDVFKVYGIPSKIGSNKDWPFRRFYQTNGKVDEEKVTELMAKLMIAPEGSNESKEEEAEGQ